MLINFMNERRHHSDALANKRTMEVLATAGKQTNVHSCLTDENVEKNGNLCCCFVLDGQGQYQDPCHTTVDRYCFVGLLESGNLREI